MKKMIVLVATVVMVMVGCNLGGISGSNIKAGIYKYESSSYVFTLELGEGTFDYQQKNTDGTLMIGYKGTFETFEVLDDDYHAATLTSLEKCLSDAVYEKVTIDGQTIKLYYSDYDDVESVILQIDIDGDGAFSIWGDILITEMERQ